MSYLSSMKPSLQVSIPPAPRTPGRQGDSPTVNVKLTHPPESENCKIMRVECGRVEADSRYWHLAAAVTGIMSLQHYNLDPNMEMESSSYSFPLQRKPRLENGTLVCPQVVSSKSRTLLLLLVGTTRLGAKNTFGKENLEAFIEYYYFMGKLP